MEALSSMPLLLKKCTCQAAVDISDEKDNSMSLLRQLREAELERDKLIAKYQKCAKCAAQVDRIVPPIMCMKCIGVTAMGITTCNSDGIPYTGT